MDDYSPEKEKKTRINIYNLPVVDSNAPLISQKKAQIILHDLLSINPSIGNRIKNQVDIVSEELHEELDYDSTGNGYYINKNELKGVVARAVIRAATQIANDLAETMTEIKSMEEAIHLDD